MSIADGTDSVLLPSLNNNFSGQGQAPELRPYGPELPRDPRKHKKSLSIFSLLWRKGPVIID